MAPSCPSFDAVAASASASASATDAVAIADDDTAVSFLFSLLERFGTVVVVLTCTMYCNVVVVLFQQ